MQPDDIVRASWSLATEMSEIMTCWLSGLSQFCDSNRKLSDRNLGYTVKTQDTVLNECVRLFFFIRQPDCV
jgi:hypothetical protein